MPSDPLVYLVVGSIVLAFAAWAGWSVGGWRRDRRHILPDQVWLCEGCHSFNDPTHETCYRCHRERADDARVVEPDPEFHLDQQLGNTKTSVSWGASSPWLAADEPLRDTWLAERARPAEATPAGTAAKPEAGDASGVGAAADIEPERDLTPSVDEPS